MSDDSDFEELETIYSLPLSPTIVSLVRDLHSGEVSNLQITKAQVLIRKSILKYKLVRGTTSLTLSEIRIHRKLSHPNIVKFVSYKETEKAFNIYIEHCNQASYFERKILDVSELLFYRVQRLTPIKNKRKLSRFAYQILQALDYLHNIVKVIHCDLKPQNIGLHKENSEAEPVVKIFDFGMSHEIQSNGKVVMLHRCGT